MWFPKEKEKAYEKTTTRCIRTRMKGVHHKQNHLQATFISKKKVTCNTISKNKISLWWPFKDPLPHFHSFCWGVICCFLPFSSTWKFRSCRSIDLNRKGLIEEDGDSLAAMLEKNKGGAGWRFDGRPMKKKGTQCVVVGWFRFFFGCLG